jgi:hypothetical protein
MLESVLYILLGLLIGYALGILRTHLPLVNYFRDYYRRQSEARMRSHTNFLITQAQSLGAALDSHRCAATASFEKRGHRSSHHLSLSVRPNFNERRDNLSKTDRA